MSVVSPCNAFFSFLFSVQLWAAVGDFICKRKACSVASCLFCLGFCTGQVVVLDLRTSVEFPAAAGRNADEKE